MVICSAFRVRGSGFLSHDEKTSGAADSFEIVKVEKILLPTRRPLVLYEIGFADEKHNLLTVLAISPVYLGLPWTANAYPPTTKYRALYEFSNPKNSSKSFDNSISPLLPLDLDPARSQHFHCLESLLCRLRSPIFSLAAISREIGQRHYLNMISHA